MIWRAKVNEWVPDWPLFPEHHKIGEVCELH